MRSVGIGDRRVTNVFRWIEETQSSMASISRKLFKDPSYLSGIKNQNRGIKLDKLDLLLQFIKDNPDGFGKGRPISTVTTQKIDLDSIRNLEGANEPCVLCGIKGSIGCPHREPLTPQKGLSVSV